MDVPLVPMDVPVTVPLAEAEVPMPEPTPPVVAELPPVVAAPKVWPNWSASRGSDEQAMNSAKPAPGSSAVIWERFIAMLKLSAESAGNVSSLALVQRLMLNAR